MYAARLILLDEADAYSGMRTQGNGRQMSVDVPIQPFRIYISSLVKTLTLIQGFHPLRALLLPLTGRNAQSGETHAEEIITNYML